MRKQATLMAMLAAAMFTAQGNLRMANEIERTSGTSLGSNPMFMPSKSQRVKNKQSRIRRGIKNHN
jgi:hypothetical protein